MRERVGLSQKELADRVTASGHMLSRVTLAKIEGATKRADRVSLEDVLAIAAALGVSPVDLIVPHAGELAITPATALDAEDARAWIRGVLLLPEIDPLAFYAAKPVDELRAIARSLLVQRAGGELEAALVHGDLSEKADDIAYELAEGEAERRRRRKRPTKEGTEHG